MILTHNKIFQRFEQASLPPGTFSSVFYSFISVNIYVYVFFYTHICTCFVLVYASVEYVSLCEHAFVCTYTVKNIMRTVLIRVFQMFLCNGTTSPHCTLTSALETMINSAI